jgi:hypothetical protein
VRGVVPKDENAGYRPVQTQVLKMRREGLLDWGFVADGTRWQRKPETFNSVEDALTTVARAYRRNLWRSQKIRIEVWLEKDALASEVTPGVEKFVRHAQAFGPELVIETAASLLPERDVARLRVEVDALERRARRRFGANPRRRRSTQETMLAVLALREQGLVLGFIGEKLGISEKRVRELLARHRRESAPPQGGKQVPDCPSRPPETAWLSGENASETAITANHLQKPSQTQQQGSRSGPGVDSSLDGEAEGEEG